LAWFADARWLGLLAEYSIKTTAVLSLAIVLAFLLRRRSAALRHFVLSVFLVGLILMPLLPSLHWGWETRLLPARAVVKNEATALETGARIGIFVEPTVGARGGAPDLTLTAHRAAGPRPADDRTASPPAPKSPLTNLLPKVWAAGLIVLLLRLALGLAGAVRLSREACPLDDSVWQRLISRFLSTVALKRRVRLKSHRRIAIPLTWGVIRPVILMPDDSRNWDEDRRSSALFHELSHVKRIDFAVMLLVRLSLAAFWFNPLSWVVFGMLKREQEKACDELVLRAGIKPSTYAASLLAFKRAAGLSWNPSLALLGMFGGPGINDRLAAILRQKLTFKEIRMRTRIILTVAIVLFVSLVGSARPAAPAPDRQAAATAAVQPPAPAAVQPAVAPQSIQETAAVAQSQEAQKKQEAEKKKEAEKAAAKEKAEAAKQGVIVLTRREVSPGRFSLVVSEGDKVKNVVLEHPIIIESGEPDKTVTLKIDGKDVVLKEGEQLRLVAKDGQLTFPTEGEAAGDDKETSVILKFERGGGNKVVTYVYPVEAVKAPKAFSPETFTVIEPGKKYYVYSVTKRREAAPEAKAVKELKVVAPEAIAAPVAVTAPGTASVIVTAPVTASVAVAPSVTVEVVEAGDKAKTYDVVYAPYAAAEAAYAVAPGEAASRKELRQKVQEIQEQLNQLVERKPEIREDLKAVEESLKALSEQLEKTSRELKKVKVYAGGYPEGYTIVKKERKGEAYAEAYAEGGGKPGALGIVGELGNDGATIFYKSGGGLKDKAAYERVVADVKKVLPEGYSLESKLEEESGTLTLKIKAPEGAKDIEGVVKKVLAVLKDELRKKPNGKD
jgi:beta-lactamase regulating signal transducer with metallopeptidase domain